MNIRDLIDTLEEIAENTGDEAEVYIMSQPNYPFEYSLKTVVQRTDFEDEDASVHETQGTPQTISSFWKELSFVMVLRRLGVVETLLLSSFISSYLV